IGRRQRERLTLKSGSAGYDPPTASVVGEAASSLRLATLLHGSPVRMQNAFSNEESQQSFAQAMNRCLNLSWPLTQTPRRHEMLFFGSPCCFRCSYWGRSSLLHLLRTPSVRTNQ